MPVIRRECPQLFIFCDSEEALGKLIDFNISIYPLDIDSNLSTQRTSDECSFSRATRIESEVRWRFRHPWFSVLGVFECNHSRGCLQIPSQYFAHGGPRNNKSSSVDWKTKSLGTLKLIVTQNVIRALECLVWDLQIYDPNIDDIVIR